MEAKLSNIDIVGSNNTEIKNNRVLQLISITLFTLSVVLSVKLLVHLILPDLSREYLEMTIIITSCLAVNIAASLILYRYQMVMEHLEQRLDTKTSNLTQTIKNLKIEREESRRHVAELKGNEAKYRYVIDNIDEGIVSLDADGNILEVNQKIVELLGCSETELLSKNLRQFLPEQGMEKTAPPLPEIDSAGGGNLANGWIVRPDGKRIPVEFVGQRVELADQTLIQAIFRETVEPVGGL